MLTSHGLFYNLCRHGIFSQCFFVSSFVHAEHTKYHVHVSFGRWFIQFCKNSHALFQKLLAFYEIFFLFLLSQNSC